MMGNLQRKREVALKHEPDGVPSDALLDSLGDVLAQVAVGLLLAHTCQAIGQIRPRRRTAKVPDRPRRASKLLPGRLDGPLERLLASKFDLDGDSDDQDGNEGGGTEAATLPNLKYMQPKYRDMSSLMSYIERDEGNGPKLVIMNFND